MFVKGNNLLLLADCAPPGGSLELLHRFGTAETSKALVLRLKPLLAHYVGPRPESALVSDLLVFRASTSTVAVAAPQGITSPSFTFSLRPGS